MDKNTRGAIERTTQRARALLERDFYAQLEGTFDVLKTGVVARKSGVHLSARQAFQRATIVAAIDRKRAAGMAAPLAVEDYVRDAAFTTLNRFVALKMLEARELVQECITRGEQSSGYREFSLLAPGLSLLPDASGYRLYIESLFDELSTEIKVLFDRRDAASVLWPERATFDAMLGLLNSAELAEVWGQDETIGWFYQFFNSKEERAAMRDPKQGGSQAPRNSRELAIRNQFFTPRYVVQFLTDNTLGRIWFQMRGGQTVLVERCAYLVRDDQAVAERPMKDPRDLKILDPACGSGHFLLYAFDLLLEIYEEAWSDKTSDVKSVLTSKSIHDDYPDSDALRRAVPALILEHNLYGVDIDPRCAQIAALALWLRAQRAFKDFGLPARERTPITRTHIVVAEPMPGDQAMIESFAANLDPPLLRDMFKTMVREMRHAGDLGALLRVEDGIAAELTRARDQFIKQRDTPGFLPEMEPVTPQGELDLSGIDDAEFFHEAESRIVRALALFAGSVTAGAATRRRLFVGDAAQGIALIDLVRTGFDVVLMNPPFGAASLPAKKEFERSYPRTKNDVYAAFVERGTQLLHTCGMLGAITSRSGFFLSSFQKWREEILLKEAPPVVFADLGEGVLDSAMVQVAAYCLEKSRAGGPMKTLFIRVFDASDKARELRDAIRRPTVSRDAQRFEVEVRSLTAVPRSPFAYWVSERMRRVFGRLQPLRAHHSAVRGAYTTDDFRFYRLSWENAPRCLAKTREETREGKTQVPLAKGGMFSRFYADIYLQLRWSNDGAEAKAFLSAYRERKGWGADWSACLNGHDNYFEAGLTWSRRTQRGLALRALPAGCIFADNGPGLFVESSSNTNNDLLALMAVVNSGSFRALVDLQMAFGLFQVGVIQATPIPNVNEADKSAVATLARRAWSLKRFLDTRTETSHAFALPTLLQGSRADLTALAKTWRERVGQVEADLAAIQAEIDERCFAFYDIDEADRRVIAEGFGTPANHESSSDDPSNAENDSLGEDTDEDDATADSAVLAAGLVSWAVGVAFGRFDVRLATSAKPLPAEPEPFDVLPVCSPAMLTGADGLPPPAAPAGYPLSFPGDGVLVDDPGHVRDITKAIHAVFDTVFGSDAEARWHEAAELLNPKQPDLPAWLANDFFEYHLKRYSKSRRKAPIVWQLSTPSASYSVWLFAHRVTSDTFFQVQNDFVGQKLNHEERKNAELVQAAGENPNARERKAISAQSDFVIELRTMLSEVKRIALLWRPDLNDGIVLTMAPLWRLVPQHRAWQRELKTAWAAICAGDYDWAHLAMHLWPERVVPICTTDRSIAIAHDLEDVFWVLDFDERWRRLQDSPGEREYIARHWAGSQCAQLATHARDLWETRYRDAGRDDVGWWRTLEDGGHDDHPLAIWLWPRRVCQRALSELRLAEAHELRLPRSAGEEKWLERMEARYHVSDQDRAFLAEAFSEPTGAPTWKAWWSRLDVRELDHLPIARYLRPEEVAAGCETAIEIADAHGVRHFFYVDRGQGPRPRLTQAEEQSREVTARLSPAVKAALASLLEAPSAGGGR